jgi:hypothetical protein
MKMGSRASPAPRRAASVTRSWPNVSWPVRTDLEECVREQAAVLEYC